MFAATSPQQQDAATITADLAELTAAWPLRAPSADAPGSNATDAKQTAVAERAYYATLDEPAASALHHLHARENVYRSYIARDRNLEFSFALESFQDAASLIQLQTTEAKMRAHIASFAIARESESIESLLERGATQMSSADYKERLRSYETRESCARSAVVWEWQASCKALELRVAEDFLVQHHRETRRVREEKKPLFDTNYTASPTGSPRRIPDPPPPVAAATASPPTSPRRIETAQQPATSTTTITASNISLFPAFPQIDFSFLVAAEERMRTLIERTALAEFRSADRALRAFHSEAMVEIALVRVTMAETLRRGNTVGWLFRFYTLMLQEREAAERESMLCFEEEEQRRQIDIVENKCWLKARETEAWRQGREKTFEVVESRRLREFQWAQERVFEEACRLMTRSELERRIACVSEEHHARSLLRELFDRDDAMYRNKLIAVAVERDVASRTLHWTEPFHDQVVVSERALRRQLVAEESTERTALLSDEVRSYISARRDELFDKDTAAAMREIDAHRGAPLSASTLPIRLAATNSTYANSPVIPRPPSRPVGTPASAGGASPLYQSGRAPLGPPRTASQADMHGAHELATSGAAIRLQRVA